MARVKGIPDGFNLQQFSVAKVKSSNLSPAIPRDRTIVQAVILYLVSDKVL